MKLFSRSIMVKIFGVLVVLVGLGMFGGQATNIDNIKGTYSFLPQELRELSPLEGAIAWHAGLVRRLYDLGHATEGEPQSKPRVEDYKNEDGTTRDSEFKEAMAKYNSEYTTWVEKIQSQSVIAIRSLFYRVPGTTSVADFKLKPHSSIDKKTDIGFAQDVAKALAGLWLYRRISDIGVPEKTLQSWQLVPGVATVKAKGLINGLKDPVFPGYDTVRLSLLAALWFKCGSNRDALKASFLTLGATLKDLKENVSKKTGLKKDVATALPGMLSKIPENIGVLDEDTFTGKAEEIIKTVDAISEVTALQDLAVYEKVVYARLLPSNQPDDVS